jgi:hypothetical protein
VRSRFYLRKAAFLLLYISACLIWRKTAFPSLFLLLYLAKSNFYLQEDAFILVKSSISVSIFTFILMKSNFYLLKATFILVKSNFYSSEK